MRTASLIFIGLVSLLHFYIAWLEIFAWTSRGPEVFDVFPADLFEKTKDMAANQGLYNAFLAAGLAWSLVIKNVEWQTKVALCFLLFVAIAGVFGAITVMPKTLLIQTVPSVIAILLLLLSKNTLE